LGLVAQAKGEDSRLSLTKALLKQLHNLASFCQNLVQSQVVLRKPHNQHDLRLACRRDLAPSKTAALAIANARDHRVLELGKAVNFGASLVLAASDRAVFTQLQPHLEELQTIVSPAGLGAYASTASTDLHLHIISKFIQVRSRLELAPRRRLGSQTCAATTRVVRSDP
jgi:hypothetical protein